MAESSRITTASRRESAATSKTADAPRVDDLPKKPQAPIVLRWFGCEAEPIGVNSDHFTIGDDGRADYPLPAALRRPTPVLLRFSRGSEGWRVSPADELAVYVNQRRSVGLIPLRSGDVVRFGPGGAGVQFTIVHLGAPTLAKLASRYAPRLPPAPGADTPSRKRSEANPPPAPVGSSSPPHRQPRKHRGIYFRILVATSIGLIALAGILALLSRGGANESTAAPSDRDSDSNGAFPATDGSLPEDAR